MPPLLRPCLLSGSKLFFDSAKVYLILVLAAKLEEGMGVKGRGKYLSPLLMLLVKNQGEKLILNKTKM